MSTFVLGLTGQTGAGKSTVGDMFRKSGIPVIDADLVAREVVGEKKQCLADIALEFTIDILNADGSLNREKLAAIVFTDKNKLKRLNTITFPYIITKMDELIKDLKAENRPMVVVDAALLFESGADKLCDKVIAVTADTKERMNRILIRDRLTDVQARNRINSQPAEDFYSKRADYTVVNDGNLSSLARKIAEIMELIDNT